MGMYTEVNLGLCFKKSTPNEVIDIMQCLLGDKEWDKELPKHKLFKCDRFKIVLVCDSAYFDGITDSKMEFDNIDGCYHLNVRSSLKNYGNEIENFIDYISPYIETDGFIGYIRYEESEHPTLIYCNNGKIEYKIIE